ncbi:uncharacterized protein ARMOST_07984 [Armillaria ostoyae]|uniref:Uncharacterized protein n=1 Tax=Armillaria ostoyae TaxID=47428 RepID=A0A284R7C4_ARMOS|nr:uncharacterized protein ARMOST_07984 [Armillaria ostoyae]
MITDLELLRPSNLRLHTFRCTACVITQDYYILNQLVNASLLNHCFIPRRPCPAAGYHSTETRCGLRIFARLKLKEWLS